MNFLFTSRDFGSESFQIKVLSRGESGLEHRTALEAAMTDGLDGLAAMRSPFAKFCVVLAQLIHQGEVDYVARTL